MSTDKPSLRPSWDEYFLSLAATVAIRSDCRRALVGAVVVSADNRVLATGYNGVSPKAKGCWEGLCPRGRHSYSEIPASAPFNTPESFCIAIHAEANALMHSSVHLRLGGILYVNKPPCPQCISLSRISGLKMIIHSEGIKVLL